MRCHRIRPERRIDSLRLSRGMTLALLILALRCQRALCNPLKPMFQTPKLPPGKHLPHDLEIRARSVVQAVTRRGFHPSHLIDLQRALKLMGAPLGVEMAAAQTRRRGNANIHYRPPKRA